MKITTSMLNNFFTCFDEARGFAINKNKILREKRICGLSYIQNKSLYFVALLIISLILILINEELFVVSLVFFMTAIVYFLIIVIRIYSSYKFKQSVGFDNVIVINEEGITDESYYGIKLTIKWDKVKGIVVGRNTITFLTDTPIYFYFSVSNKKEILDYCLNYIDKNKIIY